MYLEQNDGRAQFMEDASYYIRQNKYFVWYSAVEASHFPGRYLRRENNRLKLNIEKNTTQFRRDASFLLAMYGTFLYFDWPAYAAVSIFVG